MPYINADEKRKSDAITCVKCSNDISAIQHYVQCDCCNNYFHLRCGGIHGQNITRVSNCISWLCKDCKNLPSNDEPLKRKSDEITSPDNQTPPKKKNNQKSPTTFKDEQLNKLFTILQKSNDDLKAEIMSMKAMITEVKENQDYVSQKFDDLNLQINILNEEHSSFKTDFTKIKNQHEDQTKIIHNLEANIDKFNQKELEKNIIIGGLPNGVDEKIAIKNIMELLQTKCTMDDIYESSYLQSKIHSTNEKNRNNAPLLLLKFKTIEAKMEIMEKKKVKQTLFVNEIGINSPNDRQIYFRNHVTPFKSNLYKECQKLKADFKFQFLWMNGSKILMRKSEVSKVYAVHSQNDINKIKIVFNQKEAQSLNGTEL